MKVIIAGSRTINDFNIINETIKVSNFDIDEVVSGTAKGVDLLGELWAEKNHVPVKRFPADWDKNGKGAGYLRNEQMAAYADALIAIWDGKSKGTKHMIDIAIKKELPVFLMEV